MNQEIVYPFYPCPACHNPLLGLVAVQPFSYSQQCVSCGFSKVSPLPKLDKKIVYIDQFGISNMLKATKGGRSGEPFWQVLFTELDRLSKLNLIVAPASYFHEQESRMNKDYESLRVFFATLSGGVSFLRSDDIDRFHVLQAAKNWLAGKPDVPIVFNREEAVPNFNGWRPSEIQLINPTDNPLMGAVFRGIRRSSGQELADLMDMRWKQQAGLTSKQYYQKVFDEERVAFGRVSLERAKEYWESKLALVTGLRQPTLIDKYSPPTPAWQLLSSVEELFTAEGVPGDALASMVFKFFTGPIVANLPFNIISAHMHAAVARKLCYGRPSQPTKSPNPSILTDISMISTLLPYCDAILVDNFCKEILEDPAFKEQLPFKTLIFSSRDGDELLKFLKLQEERLTETHVRNLEMVYGRDRITELTTDRNSIGQGGCEDV